MSLLAPRFCLYLPGSLCVCLWLRLCESLNVSASVYKGVFIVMFVSLYLSLSIYGCGCVVLCAYLSVCGSVNLCLYGCVVLYVCLNGCGSLCECGWFFVCGCVCGSVCASGSRYRGSVGGPWLYVRKATSVVHYLPAH